MSEYSIQVEGEAEDDAARAAFEDLVRALRSSEDTTFTATLTTASATYTEDDVPELPAVDEAEGEDDDEPTEAEEAEPAGGEG